MREGEGGREGRGVCINCGSPFSDGGGTLST